MGLIGAVVQSHLKDMRKRESGLPVGWKLLLRFVALGRRTGEKSGKLGSISQTWERSKSAYSLRVTRIIGKENPERNGEKKTPTFSDTGQERKGDKCKAVNQTLSKSE